MTKAQKKANKEVMKEVQQGLEQGVVHTKTMQEKIQEHKQIEEKHANAYLGAVILLSATMYKLEDLIETGAPKMNVKSQIQKVIATIERDLDMIFNIKDENIRKEREAGIEKGDDTAKWVNVGVEKIEASLTNYLNE